ncbi:MAG: aminoacyl--tRNA ligase-related protein [Elusimicrobiota bacterium]
MAKQGFTPQEKNFPEWYQEVIAAADGMIYEAPVRGCYTLGPLATELWFHRIVPVMDSWIKRLGVQNITLPLFIPNSYLESEKEHVEGFKPECAVVTHAGGEKLAEPYVVRPTSETLFVDLFGKILHTYRDLPILFNQWCNICRWEKRPRAFLRTAEFFWQEGHTIHETWDEATGFAHRILTDVYARFAREMLAIPVVTGEKPPSERFAGAEHTYSIEAMMSNGWALQAGTTHVLSQRFFGDPANPAKCRVKFAGRDGTLQVPFYTSWGVSTRMIGGIIMVHGDNQGIVLPPRIAPTQAAVLTLQADKNPAVMEAATEAARRIAGVLEEPARTGKFLRLSGERRVLIDDRTATLGEKHYYHEKQGTPIRIEIGPKDAEKKQCVVVDRIAGRAGKEFVPFGGLKEHVAARLEKIHEGLYRRALDRMKAKTRPVGSWGELAEGINGGFFCEGYIDTGTPEAEDRLKRELKATLRVHPFDGEEPKPGVCLVTGKPVPKPVIIARNY